MRWSRLLIVLSFWSMSLKIWAIDSVNFKIASKPRHISPLIYGLGTYLHEDRQREGVWELKPGVYRWGGNTSSRFNYKIDAWNAGN
ncbi:MAG: hypothetical protein NTX25_20845, partial [Proteobacteria bacterium]|nr:hypothetical protein [Pseudomonadota bacterium]